MKIGILTFHRAVNYGAFFQAFALKRYLEKLDHEVCLLDHFPQFMQDQYKLLKRPRRTIYLNVNQHLLPMVFRKYVDRYLMPLKFTEYSELEADFDILIVGSDQVWNPIITRGYDYLYFLKGVRNCIKLSYAASMADFPFEKDQLDTIKSCLEDFNGVSVREDFAKKEVERLIDKDVDKVLDPVFLHDFNEFDLSDRFEEQYIATFFFHDTPQITKLIQETKRKLNLPVYNLGTVYQSEADSNELGIRPDYWLSRIKNADYILTDSFHCTVFAMKFEKKFQFVKRESRNNRVLDMLDRYHLNSRLAFQGNDIREEIDYAKVNALIDRDLEKSIAFISKYV